MQEGCCVDGLMCREGAGGQVTGLGCRRGLSRGGDVVCAFVGGDVLMG